MDNEKIDWYQFISDEYSDLLSEELYDEVYDHSMYDADPNCKHDIQILWSGFKCKHCPGWFCY